MFLMREETVRDYGAIRELTISAFSFSKLGYHGEAELIEAIRGHTTKPLSLVACLDDQLVGHILFSHVTIRTSVLTLHGMGLAPMSVAPSHQGRGVGTSLVKEGLSRLAANECSFAVVLGHPDYYQRFGFAQASQFGITHGFDGIPQNAFFVQALSGVDLTTVPSGRAYYSRVFGSQHGGT